MARTSHTPIRSIVGFSALLVAVVTTNAAPVAGAPAKTAASAKTAAGASASAMQSVGVPGLPAWSPPASYSVDMVMQGKGQTFTMKRFIAGDRVRSEIQADGQAIVMIELGDSAGTSYTVMPEQKKAIKMSSRMAMNAAGGGAAGEAPESPDAKVEFLGAEALGGVAAKKYRFSFDQGSMLAWFDATSAAPLRMESAMDGENAVIEWKNLRAGPQPDKLFAPPKGFEVIDMEEMMSKMKSMPGGAGFPGGMPGMGGLPGMAGMPGVGGVGGMAENAGRSFGEGLGSNLGASLGGAFGGPVGSFAGQYIGGKIGGWLGAKTARAVTPGN